MAEELTISESAVTLQEIDVALADLEKQRKQIETQMACLEMVKTFLLTQIRQVSNLQLKGRNYASNAYQQQ